MDKPIVNSLLDKTLDSMVKKEKPTLVRQNVTLHELQNIRLKLLAGKLDLSIQAFILKVLDAAMYDVELKLSLRDTSTNGLSSNGEYMNLITREYAEEIKALMDEKKEEDDEDQ